MKGFVKETVRARKPKRLLEIGCGSGIYMRFAAEANPDLTGIGIDPEEDVVQHARQNLIKNI